MAEQPFRRALAISQGGPAVFIAHPISAGLLAVAALVLGGPRIFRAVQGRQLWQEAPYSGAGEHGSGAPPRPSS